MQALAAGLFILSPGSQSVSHQLQKRMENSRIQMRLIALASLNLRLCVSSILGQITWLTLSKTEAAVNILFLLSISDISTPGRCHRCWENLFQRALHVVGCLPDSVAGLLMSSTVLLLYTAIIVPVQICMWNYDDPCNKFPTLPFDVIVDCFFMV